MRYLLCVRYNARNHFPLHQPQVCSQLYFINLFTSSVSSLSSLPSLIFFYQKQDFFPSYFIYIMYIHYKKTQTIQRCVKIKGKPPITPLQRNNHHCFQFLYMDRCFFLFYLHIYKFVIFQHLDYTLPILNFSLKIFQTFFNSRSINLYHNYLTFLHNIS